MNSNNVSLKEVVPGVSQTSSVPRPAVAERDINVFLHECTHTGLYMHVCGYTLKSYSDWGGRVLVEVNLSAFPSPHQKLDQSYSGYCI